MTTKTIKPLAQPAAGSIAVPGSKSVGNRALLLAGCAVGTSRLSGLLDSDDTEAALSALAALGVPCRRDGDWLVVDGAGLDFPNKSGEIHIRSSGTVGRFLPGLLCAAPAGEWTLTATPQLSSRPIDPLVQALRRLGGRVETMAPPQSFPLRITAGGLAGGSAEVSAKKSSQFASGLLLAAPLCRASSEVRIADLDPDERYVEITLDLMRRFGVTPADRSADGSVYSFAGQAAYQATELAIEADANTAGYFLALAALTGGSVKITNLHADSLQPGIKFLDIIARLGAEVSRSDAVAVSGGELPLRGGFAIDMRAMSEMALTLGVMAVFADQPITMTNLAHIRGHESDRLAALCAILARLGVRCDETADAVTVHPQAPRNLPCIEIDPLDDHRLAMSFAVLGAAANGITIRSSGCVAKTCPDFFSMLGRVGVQVS
ncbi:MAG: 3-phosphoshikimate 1-carboxyvinyltransferase [Planctomycetes bacterium]|nr:3-phosphoshikimate 1-carboxyvinyltransferase [Planctomycetota bacterium]